MKSFSTEAAKRADFSMVRYAQVWEDADILVEALNIGPDSICLSIASAGDNALALLTKRPAKVYALDLNPAQLHCLALRVAAFKCLDYDELLELIGEKDSDRRDELYGKCIPFLSEESRLFWNARRAGIRQWGMGSLGKFEHYFKIFRTRIMPLIHSKGTIDGLFYPRDAAGRKAFYEKTWNNYRWRMLFKLFFSRFMMGRLGRDPAFFRYVEGSVADRILERTYYALTELAPEENPYLQWILLGHYHQRLPRYLRKEHFDTIRENLDHLEWHQASVEEFTAGVHEPILDACNLSDIFEYMSEENTEQLLRQLHRISHSGARFAYWNMLAPRSRPECLGSMLKPLPDIADALFQQDKAFFYSKFIVEEVIK